MFDANYVLILLSVLVISFGQIMFKLAARSVKTDWQNSWVELVQQNALPIGLIVIALSLYFLSTIAWVYALRTVPLSVAFMFNALAFIIVPSAAFVFFGEAMPKHFLLGMPLVLVGIYLISRG